MNSILVTGSNRGLGLEWVRQYARLGWRVYATCRFLEQAEELHRLASDHPNVSLHPLDVTRSEQIEELARELNDVAIDILVNNAGVYYERWGKVGVLLLHPGWVQTRMGGDSAPYTPAESVQGMRQIIDDFTLEQSGVFLRFDGTRMPW